MRRKQGPIMISQCSKDLQELRANQKDMIIRMEKMWIKRRIGEIENE